MPSIRRSACAALAAIFALSQAAGEARANGSYEARKTLLRNTTDSWSVGDRIRVTSPEPYFIQTTGWFVDTQVDSLLLLRTSKSDPPLPIRLSQIGMLEERAGFKRHLGTGAIVGTALGTIVGLFLAASHRNDQTGDEFQLEGLEDIYIPIGMAAGLVVGAAVGYSIKSDRWRMAAEFE